MRDTYLKKLYELAEKDTEVVSLVSDNGLIVYDDFRRDFPDRYYNFGIAEENMVAAAAGMASCGKIPFAYTISAFIAYRAYEFLRDDVCFQNQNVKLVGIGSGLTYSTLGPSHHTTEDIGLLRSLPNLTIFSPSTRMEVAWMMEEAYKINGPVYIRLSNNTEEYYKEDVQFSIGEPAVVQAGNDVTIFLTGSIINEVMDAVKKLENDGISVEVVSVHTLKPVNAQVIAKLLKKTKRLITVEEHNVIGGLHSLIAEVMAIEGIMVPNMAIGLCDTFATDYGKLNDVRRANGLDSGHICDKILKLVKETDNIICCKKDKWRGNNL